MPLKLVVHELNAPDRVRQLDSLLRQVGDVVSLTSSTFVVDTSLNTTELLKKLMKAVELEDDIYVLELSSFWSGYGTVTASQFLRSHMPTGRATRPGTIA